MRIAPSFIKKGIVPTKKSLMEFVDQLHNTYQNFSQAFNGRISYGDGTNNENIDGSWASVTTPAPAGTSFTVTHGLQRIPVGVHVTQKNAFCDVLIVSSTKTQITLQASAAGAVIKLFIFLFFFLLLPSYSFGQGANHTNQAFKTVTVSGSTGIGGGQIIQPIAGATITVCNGSTLPGIGATCTGLASIFSNITLTNAISNPTNADNNGNYSFYASAGTNYVISVSGVGLTTYSYVWTAPLVFGSGSSLSVGNINNIIYIGAGSPYPQTCAGINSAIAAAPAGGGAFGTMIWVGAGDIPCNVIILVDKPIILRMSFQSSRIIPAVGFAGPVILMDRDANSVLNQYGQSIGQVLENVWIEDTAFRSQNTDGVWIRGQDHALLNHISVKNLKGYGLQLANTGVSGNKPVRESVFENVDIWDSGDPTQSKPCLNMISDGTGDDINEIRFTQGGVQSCYYRSVDIDTLNSTQGPRHIYFDNFQMEARATLNSATGIIQNTTPPQADVFYVGHAGNIGIAHSSISGIGQGFSGINLVGTAGQHVGILTIKDSTVGGQSTVAGTVNTSGTAVTWVSGDKFTSDGSWNGMNITINSVSYAISTVISTTSLTLGSSAGTQTSVSYAMSGGGYGISTTFADNPINGGINWLFNPLGDEHYNTANMAVSNACIHDEPPIGNGDGAIAGMIACTGTDTAYEIKNLSGGQGYVLDSTNTGDFNIFPKTSVSGNIKLHNALKATNNGLQFLETTAPSGISNVDYCYGDSSQHTILCSMNNGPFTPLAGIFTKVVVAPVTVNANVSTDQNGMAITINAGALNSVSRTLLIQLAGVYSTPAASTTTLTHKLKLCTVSGCGSGTVITLASWTTSALGGVQATNNPYNCIVNSSTQTAGASAAFEAHGNLTIDLAALASAAEAVFADNNTATVGTIDSTAQLFLQHTIAFGTASASNSATDRQMIADTVD